jgi:hypothetical protein
MPSSSAGPSGVGRIEAKGAAAASVSKIPRGLLTRGRVEVVASATLIHVFIFWKRGSGRIKKDKISLHGGFSKVFFLEATDGRHGGKTDKKSRL